MLQFSNRSSDGLLIRSTQESKMAALLSHIGVEKTKIEGNIFTRLYRKHRRRFEDNSPSLTFPKTNKKSCSMSWAYSPPPRMLALGRREGVSLEIQGFPYQTWLAAKKREGGHPPKHTVDGRNPAKTHLGWCLGFQLPTSTGFLAGFRTNHQQYQPSFLYGELGVIPWQHAVLRVWIPSVFFWNVFEMLHLLSSLRSVPHLQKIWERSFMADWFRGILIQLPPWKEGNPVVLRKKWSSPWEFLRFLGGKSEILLKVHNFTTFLIIHHG